MFTGLISDIGTILHIDRGMLKGESSVIDQNIGPEMRARIGCNYNLNNVLIGASIACDGVCLSVVAKGTDWFDVDISQETISKSNVGDWIVGDKVNLEKSLKLGDELGGHLVSGHVDGLAQVLSITDDRQSSIIRLRTSQSLSKFIATKGSVALNGTSLTVNFVDQAEFTINLIPHTKRVTNWGKVNIGDMINLEVDTIARYVERLSEATQNG